MRKIKKIVIFLLFLSAVFSISYWAVAKYDVYSDYKACGDAFSYIKMSKHDYSGIQQRYLYRPLMPWIVSILNDHLKIDKLLGKYYENVDKKIIQLNFGIINIISLALTAYLLFYYCLYLGFSELESLLGAFLFFTSFFVVNYYTVPMVDSLSSFFIMAGFYAVLKCSLRGIFLSFLFGVFTKETTFVILPLIILEERRLFSKKLLVCLPAVILYILFIVSLQDKLNGSGGFYIFKDAINIVQGKFLKNAFKELSLYTVIEYMQTFMFLWVLSIYSLFKCKKPLFLRRAAWLMLFPVITPFLGAAAVGRVVFYFFPIVIPLSLLALRDILNSKYEQT